jgi:hypothetical protein
MNISKALKLKNKLVSEYNEVVVKMVHSNCREEGRKKHYNSKDLYQKSLALMDQIIDIKTAIHKASEPVRSKIFEIGEYKSFLTKVGALNTTEGAVKDSGYGATSYTNYIVDFTEEEKQVLLEELKSVIEKLQDELDAFNATTEVDRRLKNIKSA